MCLREVVIVLVPTEILGCHERLCYIMREDEVELLRDTDGFNMIARCWVGNTL